MGVIKGKSLASVLLILGVSMGVITESAAFRLGGFEVSQSDALIPLDEVRSGGPDKDGIPSIDKPRFVTADETNELKSGDVVMGLEYNGMAKAYPISIMNWHEIVNDNFADSPVVVTYCPLCGSGMAFSANVGGLQMKFGVSGLLYNSDVLLYDRQTDSLWSQILGKAVTGSMTGTRLTMLPLVWTTWRDWEKRYPETLVLSRETGFKRNYDKDPYAGYEDSKGVWFPVKHKDARYHPKERVLGVELDGRFKAYPFAELSRTDGTVQDSFSGHSFTVEYDDANKSARITGVKGEKIPSVSSFWFAWYAFHPDTEVFTAK